MRVIQHFTVICLLAVTPYSAKAQSADPNFDACFHKSGDEAITACTAVIGSGQHSAAVVSLALANRGLEYFGKRDFVRAGPDFIEAIRLDPKNAMAYFGRGSVYLMQNNYAAAIADLSKAIRLDPKDAMAFNNRGYAYLKQKNYARAIADYTDVIRLSSQEEPTALYGRGLARAQSGHAAEAQADMDRALSLDPKIAERFKK